MGYDPDAPMAQGEVGKVGVSIASIEDMHDLFEGIPLDRVSTSMTINATASILLALYVATARRQGVAAERLSGTVQNDILKEYIARGTYIFPPGPSMRLITDTFAYCTDRVPHWNTISISGYHMREAGCTAVQEVAFTLANGIAYVQAALDAGLTVDAFAPQLSFFFNAHNDLLEEVRAHESGVADIADPLGGAFAIERLTGEIEEAARVYIRTIDDLGGAVAAIPFMQREIQEAAYRYQREVEEHARIVVGVNEFVTDELPQGNLFQVDAAVGPALAERVARARAARDREAAGRALDALERAARGRENLLPLLVIAVEVGVTLGEICDRLRGVFGVHQPSVAF